MALRVVSPLSICPAPYLFPHSKGPTSSLQHLSGNARSSGLSAFAAGHAQAPLERETPSPSQELRGGDEEDTLLVQELEELPEQWRRSKVAWLCKQLPGQKPGNVTRLLNAQRKWISQQDVTYVVVHCLRIRDNDAAHKVYRWMLSQPRFQFDFALASKLADCLGKDRKFLKCRDVFDEIIKQGRVPSESTFHNLAAAYLGAAASVQGCLDDACDIYNKMIKLGGFSPRPSLHAALFRALLDQPGFAAKRRLEQAEFIFSNLHELKQDIQKEVYAGLIRLHSHQNPVDMARIEALREDMQRLGMAEDKDVVVSVLRACCSLGAADQADVAWKKLLQLGSPPVAAFELRMELHAKSREPLLSLEVFRSMAELGVAATSSAYDKIIQLLAGARETAAVEQLLAELVAGGVKPSPSSFANAMHMYAGLAMHDDVERWFEQCRAKIQPSRGVYNAYLSSLAAKPGALSRAEEIFECMQSNAEIGINSCSCNALLRAALASNDEAMAEDIHRLMKQKRYEVDPLLDRILGSKKKKIVRQPAVRLKLDVEQREILIGMLLGGLHLKGDESGRTHSVHFEFSRESPVHSLLRGEVHRQFLDWVEQREEDDLFEEFSTVPHWVFNFFADKFRPNGRAVVPVLIARWASPRALAYWYMYSGLRSSAGDVLLRLKGVVDEEDALRIVRVLQGMSMGCGVKKRGRSFWVGLRGADAARFWDVTEPYILDGVKTLLNPCEVVQGPPSSAQEESFD
ncbi:endonuclease [Wolffia australiana]